MSNDAAQLKALYATALKLQQAGKGQEALRLYQQINAANPKIPEVHFQVARLFLAAELPQRAIGSAKAAAALRPAEGEAWKVWADAVRTLSDKTERRIFAEALSKAPIDKRLKGTLSTATALTGKSKPPLGSLPPKELADLVALVSREEYAAAERLADTALRQHPDAAPLHDLRATALAGQGRVADAIAASETALRLAPGFAAAWANSAEILRKAGRPTDGIARANRALKLAPGLPTALINRAECMFDMSRSADGVADLRRALDVEPKNAHAIYRLAQQLLFDRDLFAARDVLQRAQRQGITSTRLELLLANVLSEMNETEGAEKLLTTLAARHPENAAIHSRLAVFRQTNGEFDAAEEAFQTAMRADPARGDTYRQYVTSRKDGVADDLMQHMQEQFANGDLSKLQRSHFGFALAKVMEDEKRYDEVFGYLHPANAMMREHLKVAERAEAESSADLMQSLRTLDWSTAPMNEASDAAPIFVTGMPRSGTTLVEQIIAAHSSITGGGELGVAVGRCRQLMSSAYDKLLPVKDVPLSAFAELADWYDGYIRQLFPDADRVTDKSIQTYAFIGVLKRAMPKARFVVVRRDPRDNLLSIYKNAFPDGGHEYAYSLTDLAGAYRDFVGFIDLWRDLTPDWFHEVHYEDLIGNPEGESRKLIDACGLDWEDACLDFHKDDRRVKTLSLYQVRQPIYRSSSKAWMRYRNDLAELFDALGPDYADAAE